jgi:hypothetical protein
MDIPNVQESLSGPHLQLACFCEKVLIEASQVVSLIRIVDRFTVSGQTPEMAPASISVFMVVSFKAGFIRGKHKIRVAAVSPNGTDLPPIEIPQLFEGEDRGCMIATQMNMLVQEEGLYWFRVFFEDIPVTQMPLRVVYQRTEFGVQVGN